MRGYSVVALAAVVVFGLWACEAETGGPWDEGGQALTAAADPTATADPGADDAVDAANDDPPICRIEGRVVAAADPAVSDVAEVEAPRILVKIKVAAVGPYLRIGVRFSNPYRCHWRGDLYLEREAPSGEVSPIARRYDVLIRGGTSVGGWLLVRRPAEPGGHRFVARAYAAAGQDREGFSTCAPAVTDAALAVDCAVEAADTEPYLAEDVVEDGLAVPAAAVDEADPCPTLVARPPIFVDLWLEHAPGLLRAYAAWENTTRRRWTGDLYVDLTDPWGDVTLLRRDLGVAMEPGIGFCTFDETARPTEPGRYVVRARALRRDGSGAALWVRPGTTEITAVCNRELCELIEPDARAARLTLTGPSQLHLESDFFSEHTEVILAWGGARYDVTDRCRISQEPAGGRNHVTVAFDTFDLPIGPRTWGYYTVRLHPMPVVPPGAKTSDSLWILTNGGE